MTEEENKAIEFIEKEIKNLEEAKIEFSYEIEDESWLRKHINELDKDIFYKNTILNLIKKLKKENEDREQAHMKLYNEFRQYKDWDSIPKEKIREKIEELKNQIEILKAMPEYENRKLEAIINVENLENIVFYFKNQVLEEE